MNPRQLLETWATDTRWKGIIRPYRAEEVLQLRGSFEIKYTLAEMGAKRRLAFIANRGLHNVGRV